MASTSDPANPFIGHVNLADPRLGAGVLSATDDFFADKDRLLDPAPAAYIAGKFDDHGKWMDGWESRRRRDPGYDWCVIRLARPGRILGVDIDTSFFTGNYPAAASLQACRVAGELDANADWREILPALALTGNAHHFHAIADAGVWTHLRLNMFPDGGIARLRVYGQVDLPAASGAIDLVSVLNGARVVGTNGSGYGPPINMLMPWKGQNMSDAWETRRRREPGFDWAIIAFAAPARIERIEIDTAFHKGNYPAQCAVHAAALPRGLPDAAVIASAIHWPALLPATPMRADCVHVFEAAALAETGPVSHVRVDMIPDGGISRLRIIGRPG